MWIDTICINQEDDTKKGRQVQSIAKIYTYANHVIVWLGEAANDSGEAFKALRKAVKEQHAHQTIDEPTQQAIFALLKRPWFQRIWVRGKDNAQLGTSLLTNRPRLFKRLPQLNIS